MMCTGKAHVSNVHINQGPNAMITNLVEERHRFISTPDLDLHEESLGPIAVLIGTLHYNRVSASSNWSLSSTREELLTVRLIHIIPRSWSPHDILNLLSLHDAPLIVSLFEHELVWACSTLEPIDAGRVILGTDRARHCEGVGASRADCPQVSVYYVVFWGGMTYRAACCLRGVAELFEVLSAVLSKRHTTYAGPWWGSTCDRFLPLGGEGRPLTRARHECLMRDVQGSTPRRFGGQVRSKRRVEYRYSSTSSLRYRSRSTSSNVIAAIRGSI